jgi:hypothetical protein
LIQAKKQNSEEANTGSEEANTGRLSDLTWKATQMKAYFGLSGGLVGINWNSLFIFSFW